MFTLGTLHWNRNARSPTLPVRICIRRELSCFLRPRCFWSAFFALNSGSISAGSTPGPSWDLARASTLPSYYSLQSLSTASSVVSSPSTHHRHTYRASCSPSLGRSCSPIDLILILCLRRRVATAVQVQYTFLAMPVYSSLDSNSATLLLRCIWIDGTAASTSRCRTWVARYPLVTVRRHSDCAVLRWLAIPRVSCCFARFVLYRCSIYHCCPYNLGIDFSCTG